MLKYLMMNLIPFLGTTLGSSMVFFLNRKLVQLKTYSQAK